MLCIWMLIDLLTIFIDICLLRNSIFLAFLFFAALSYEHKLSWGVTFLDGIFSVSGEVSFSLWRAASSSLVGIILYDGGFSVSSNCKFENFHKNLSFFTNSSKYSFPFASSGSSMTANEFTEESNKSACLVHVFEVPALKETVKLEPMNCNQTQLVGPSEYKVLSNIVCKSGPNMETFCLSM